MQASKIYSVNKIDGNQLEINGKGSHPLWEKAEINSDFSSPWNTDEIKKIEFRALWDHKNFHFLFKVFDNDINVVTTDNSNASINDSDRVELFFRTDKSLNPYYCLEIDPTPRLMDFKALPNKVFDFNWNWPKKDIQIKSNIEDSFFTVEGSISLKSLVTLNILKNGQLETGIFRAKYNTKNEPTWIAWVNPKTETPNFHTPTAFGLLKLQDS